MTHNGARDGPDGESAFHVGEGIPPPLIRKWAHKIPAMSVDIDGFRIATTTGPWTTEAWELELVALTLHVERCFAAATTKYTPPSQDGCLYFANCLLTYFLPSPKKDGIGSKEQTIKHANTFLKHLSQEGDHLKKRLQAATVFNNDAFNRTVEDQLLLFEKVKRDVKSSIEILSPKRSAKNDGVRFLGKLAQDLWKETKRAERRVSTLKMDQCANSSLRR